MNTFKIECELAYDVKGPSDFLFQIEAARYLERQVVLDEKIEIEPSLAIKPFTDNGVGNRFFRLRKATPGPLKVRYEATVLLERKSSDTTAAELPIEQLPDEVLHYLMPSRYCESDILARTAYRTFGAIAPGYSRVQAIVEWIKEHIDYEIGSSGPTTTARDVLVSRAGVCRDFSHLGISFCRALNIPARLVVGYVRFDEPPQDFHAIFEAYLGGQWHLFDATGLAPVDQLIRVGTGRDAKDVAFSTIFGDAVGVGMNIDIREIAAQVKDLASA